MQVITTDADTKMVLIAEKHALNINLNIFTRFFQTDLVGIDTRWGPIRPYFPL